MWYEEEEEKARVLLDTFFPAQPQPTGILQDNYQPAPTADTIGEEIREEECERAIFSSNPRKAPGPDDMPFRVWQAIWQPTKSWIVCIYQRSLTLGHPWWIVRPKHPESIRHFRSPLVEFLDEFRQVLESNQHLPIETIKPFIQGAADMRDVITYIVAPDRK